MNEAISRYINRINAKDAKLTKIDLNICGLTNDDIEPLMEALNNNLVMASKITKLELEGNKLTSFHLPECLLCLEVLNLSNNQLASFTCHTNPYALKDLLLNNNELTSITIEPFLHTTNINLDNNRLASINYMHRNISLRIISKQNAKISLSNNPLSTVTKIAFNYIQPLLTLLGSNKLVPDVIAYDKPVATDVVLTPELIEQHFRTILCVNRQAVVDHLKRSGIIYLLWYLPAEVVLIITNMLFPRPEIEAARDNMSYLKEIYGLDESKTQINTYYDLKFKLTIEEAINNNYLKPLIFFKRVIDAKLAKEKQITKTSPHAHP